MKNKIIKDALVLLAITLVAGVALGLVYEITKTPIAEGAEKAKQEAYSAVFADATFEEDEAVTAKVKELGQTYDGAIVTEVLVAKGSDGSVAGYVMSLTAKEGYGGAITLTMGVKADGTISGLTVLEASETAGLGAKCKEPEFQSQFPGKHGPNMEVVKGGGAKETQIDAISGATITSKAITKAVNAGLNIVAEIQGN
ncbi:MAG: RnfABCDGE type electron transport complex subunit G [Lachnospiraceae bacterium]|jgi:electron transport complex protein RnfG|nr:RnfABCDGE type electron transport complex subunit G [Lachnospiraceae bacterium]